METIKVEDIKAFFNEIINYNGKKYKLISLEYDISLDRFIYELKRISNNNILKDVENYVY